MNSITFDTLKYFNKMKSAGMPEEQAQVQAEALRELAEGQLVSKSHFDLKMAELETKIKEQELRLLKWQIGIGFALAVIMAKGFGWLGF